MSLKENISNEIRKLEKMIENNEKDESIREQKNKLDKLLEEYIKDL